MTRKLNADRIRRHAARSTPDEIRTYIDVLDENAQEKYQAGNRAEQDRRRKYWNDNLSDYTEEQRRSANPGYPKEKEEISVDSKFETHSYISTACLHQLHRKCRVKCKWCEARCICDCHEYNKEE